MIASTSLSALLIVGAAVLADGERHLADQGKEDRDRWARLRFAIIGPLLAAPPTKGRLQAGRVLNHQRLEPAALGLEK